MKRNVLQWICSTMTDATSAIILTHNIDFLFLQSIVRPRLRKCGHPKLTVFADAACAAGSYRQQRHMLDGLGKYYRVVQVDMGNGRRFHPKAILLTGPSKAALAIGSGNLTHGGWSANYEIWSCYESDADGQSAISAFRNYMRNVLNLVPHSDSVSEEALSPFDQTANSWVANLPEPDGIYGVPGERPLLDVIVDLAGDDVQQVTVCAPYYDPDGEALAELSRRIASPVRALLQRKHAGISEGTASNLPKSVQLVSVDVDPSRFIHAKVYGFTRSDSTLLVVGSANISRAALIGNGTWGNAELVAAQAMPSQQADEIFSDIKVLDSAPDLPEISPSDEWEIQASLLRIISARFYNGILEIVYKSEGEAVKLFAEMDGGTKECSLSEDSSVARLQLAKCPNHLKLHCVFKNGLEASSEPSWVDNEDHLSISVPERRIAAKLAEAAESGFLSPTGMFEILQLLHQHLQHPAKRSSIASARENESQRPRQGASYDLDDIFSEGFGRPKTNPNSSLPGGLRETDFFQAFSAYFDLGNSEHTEEKDHPKRDPQRDVDPDEEEAGEISDEKAKELLDERQKLLHRIKEAARLRKKLLAALESVATAMASDEFVLGRPPERLGADIAATALLIKKGLTDKIIPEEDFANITKRLWATLFFSPTSVIKKRLASCSFEERYDFETAITTPRLTAALTLWCLPDWSCNSREAIQFRLSAMLLVSEFPWLVSGGTIEELHGEFRRLSRTLPESAKFEALVAVWANWIRGGAAFNEFERALKNWNSKELAESIRREEVTSGELLWQSGGFFLADANYRRDAKTNATIHSVIRPEEVKLFKGNRLVPVSDLLHQGSPVVIDDRVRETLQGIFAEIDTMPA